MVIYCNYKLDERTNEQLDVAQYTFHVNGSRWANHYAQNEQHV